MYKGQYTELNSLYLCTTRYILNSGSLQHQPATKALFCTNYHSLFSGNI